MKEITRWDNKEKSDELEVIRKYSIQKRTDNYKRLRIYEGFEDLKY